MNKNSKSRSLVMLTALIAVVLLAASWFLLISPVLAATAEADTNAQAQEDKNANTQIEVNKLKAQYANLPQYEAELAGLQEQIPTSQEYADLQRLFAAVAEKHKVIITSLQFGVATKFENTKVDSGDGESEENSPTEEPATEPSPEPTEGTSTTGGEEPPAAGAGKSALYAIPVTVVMDGKYDDVMAALNELQTGTTRLVLVTNVVLTQSDAPDAEEGDSTGEFGGQTFVLTSSQLQDDAAPDSPDEGASPAPSPTP